MILIIRQAATEEQVRQMANIFDGVLIKLAVDVNRIRGRLMDLKAVYQRFEQLSWQQRLGNIASTLARISSQATAPESDQLVTSSLREVALLIEWSAPQVPPDFLLELAALQREALAWQRCWPLEEARSLLALHSRNQSDRLLQMAGLLELKPSSAATLETRPIKG